MLDAKTITLGDGKPRTLRVTWGAIDRIRETTGLDLIDAPDGKELLRKIPAVLHACLLDREAVTVEELKELIDFSTAKMLLETIISGMTEEGAAKPDNAPHPRVNGVAKESPSSGATPSDGTTSV